LIIIYLRGRAPPRRKSLIVKGLRMLEKNFNRIGKCLIIRILWYEKSSCQSLKVWYD
jgi:hypothetical protein